MTPKPQANTLDKLLTIKIANLMIGKPYPNVGQIIDAIMPIIQTHTTEASEIPSW